MRKAARTSFLKKRTLVSALFVVAAALFFYVSPSFSSLTARLQLGKQVPVQSLTIQCNHSQKRNCINRGFSGCARGGNPTLYNCTPVCTNSCPSGQIAVRDGAACGCAPSDFGADECFFPANSANIPEPRGACMGCLTTACFAHFDVNNAWADCPICNAGTAPTFTTVSCDATPDCKTSRFCDPTVFCGVLANGAKQCVSYDSAIYGHDGCYQHRSCAENCWEKDGSPGMQSCINKAYTAVIGWHRCPSASSASSLASSLASSASATSTSSVSSSRSSSSSSQSSTSAGAVNPYAVSLRDPYVAVCPSASSFSCALLARTAPTGCSVGMGACVAMPAGSTCSQYFNGDAWAASATCWKKNGIQACFPGSPAAFGWTPC